MGKIVESYKMALESETSWWSGFTRTLRNEELEAFNALMDVYRVYASAAGNATQPILFEPMVMSMRLYQQMYLQKLQKELNALKQQPNLQP
ncbi:MAG: hypothetical protein ABSD42_02085 [Candidatus Bathyarchaeia archaeon]|jgi:hypothetical protein